MPPPPEISTHVDNKEDCDTILLGYPTWYGGPPMAVLIFLEDYDLSGKTVITFCTSGGSSISGAMSYIRGSAEGADIIQGVRMTSTVDLAAARSR